MRIDNSWEYHERTTGQRYQWNDKNFNANYGGIPKNVFLHVTYKIYQTLPLYNNLKTTGIYIYGTDYDIKGRKVTVNAESQVKNEDSKPRSFRFFAKVTDADGKEVAHLDGKRYTLQPGETQTVKVSGTLTNAHFWSWGYGYLYNVRTLLKADDGSKIDDVVTRTGFRKTQFGEGKFLLDNRTIHFNYQGELEWLGGIATPNEETQKKLADKKQSLVVNKNETTEQKATRKAADILDSTDSDNTFDNYVGSIDLPVECGVNRVLVRSTANPGNIKIFAGADGIKGVAEIDLNTEKVDIAHYLPQHTLRGDLSRGETPSTPSYTDIKETLDIAEVVAGSNQEDTKKTFDDDETTEWKSDGNPKNAWITYQLAKKDVVNEITMKLTGWRDKMYPLAIYAGKKKIWEGYTYVCLGYVHINIDKPVKAKELTIKMIGDAKSKTQLGDTKELAGGKASTLDFIGITKGKPVLRIVEIDLLKNK